MKQPQRDDFFKWYHAEKAKGTQFDMQRDLVSYCELDVDILMQCAMKFRQLLLDLHKFDAFTCASTIASTCMKIYRKRFMQLESIAIVPHGGYRKNDKQSIFAIKYLKWLAESENANIQHARNGGEVSVFILFVFQFVFSIYQCFRL